MHLSSSPQETHQFGIEIGESRKSGAVLALVGELGAGKTEFVKGVVEGAGCKLDVTSPTFTLLHEYTGGKPPVYHFDFYRLERAEEVLEAGWDDYLKGGGIVVVEWADKFPELLPDRAVWFYFRITGEESREIKLGKSQS